MARHSFERFPVQRVATVDVGALGRGRHLIAALLEVDVTEARARMGAWRQRSGERLSFTAWLIHVVAAALADHPTVHAYPVARRWRAVPPSVDVSTVVEREVAGERIPVPTLIRGADSHDVAELTALLDEARQGPVQAGTSWLGGAGALRTGAWLYGLLPGGARRGLWRTMLSIPPLAGGLMGSAMISSVGMMGRVDGWFLHTSIHPVSIGVGSIVRKPKVLAGDRIAPRDVLKLTVLLDHDVVDGADMARFVDALVRRLEAGQGLPGGSSAGGGTR